MDTAAPPTPPSPPQPPPSPRRPLRRDRANRILGGVAAGIAETYGLDTTLVRVLFVIAGVFWIGIPIYIVAWIAIPPGDGSHLADDRPRDIGLLLGLALVGIGALIFVDHALPTGWHPEHIAAPLFLIGGGIAILVLRRPSHSADDPTDATDVTEPLEIHDAVPADAVHDAPPTAWTQTAEWPAPPSASRVRREQRRARRAQRPRPFLTPLALSLLLIGAGVTSLLQATGAVDVNLTIALAIATGFVGAVMILSTWVGRAHGLIAVGIVLALATGISSVLDVPLHGGIGEQRYHPTAIDQLHDPYQLGIGHLLIDLRDLPVAGADTTVRARLGIGELEVLVPSTVQVVVNAHAGAGSVMLFGRDTGGWDHTEQRVAVGSGTGVLHLDLRVGAGQVRVRRYEPGGIETLIGGSTP